MRLLGMVLGDAETSDLEKVFKHEPGLSMNLMRLTNSVATGVRVKVTSMRHAITVLGRRQLQRWLQLLLYTNPAGGNVASPLLQLAATRGRLMELLAGRVHPGKRDLEDQAFMVGIMSLMPTLMAVPMAEILGSISVATEVRAALEAGGGLLGEMFKLTAALENGDGEVCHTQLERLPGLTAGDVNAALTQALAWANNIARENAA
jgi:EAL and modified HD-GYP domain-containing signal transduction protein